MDLQNAVKKAGQGIRIPLDVIRRQPDTIRHVLGMCLDIPEAKLEAWRLFNGWGSPRTGAIIILAEPPDHDPLRRPPVILECTQVRPYDTLVTVYEVDH